jgi:hypothetical protein
MSDDKEQKDLVGDPPRGNGGLSLVSTLTLIFVVLKLTGNIQWRWFWVLSPLWGSLVIQVFLLALYFTALAAEEKNRK